MLICFYGDHTQTHTLNSVSHVLALSHAWSKQDRARSNWIGLNLDRKPRETSLVFIFLIVCLRYSGILNPWFLLLGPFFLFLIYFFGLPGSARRWVQRTGLWGLDWTSHTRERENIEK